MTRTGVSSIQTIITPDEAELVLTFPKERVSEITVKGMPMVQYKTGMTTQEFIQMLLRFAVSGESMGTVYERGKEE